MARSSQEDGAAHKSELSLMNDLSQRFLRLETHLAAGDAQAFASVATELAGFVPKLPALRPKDGEALGEEFDRHVGRFEELVAEAAELASRGRLVETGQALEDLRATCVSCHLKFRSNNETRGIYPAVMNTVAGAVELRDVDGSPREDRSWVLVFLEGGPSSLGGALPRRNPRVTQSARQFFPRVLPVPVGATVDFPNDDTIFHNVFSLSKSAPFDLGVYEPGESSSVRMERTGLVKVYCNIHPEMAASIVVLANRWYALTDATGHFVISGVPDGDYVLRAWNDMGAEAREPIRLEDGLVLTKRLTVQETKRALAHTNKFGKPYSGKYR